MAKIPINQIPLVGTKGTPSPKKEGKVTIHDVYIIDSSGSMGSVYEAGTKAYNAINGLLENQQASLNDTLTDKLFTTCIFGDTSDLCQKAEKEVIREHILVKRWQNGMTALRDAIGDTIEHLNKIVKQGEKVSIKIFTDGGENHSRRFSQATISQMIEKKTKKGWNIAFIGTEDDVRIVQRDLKVDKSNTLVYDGTGKGFEKSMAVTRDAMVSYSVAADKGEDVSLGFFSKDIV